MVSLVKQFGLIFHGNPQSTFRAVFPLSCRTGSAASGGTRRLRAKHHSAFESPAKRDWNTLRSTGRERRFPGILAALPPPRLTCSRNLRRKIERRCLPRTRPRRPDAVRFSLAKSEWGCYRRTRGGKLSPG